MDISSRSSPRLKAKEKMFKHLLLALPLTLWAGSFIRGHKAPLNGWAESDILALWIDKLYISVSVYYPVAAAYFSTLISVCRSPCVSWWRALGLQRYSLIIPTEKQTARGRNTMLLALRAADSISGEVVRAGVWGLAEAEGLSWGLAVSPPLSDLSQSSSLSRKCVGTRKREIRASHTLTD